MEKCQKTGFYIQNIRKHNHTHTYNLYTYIYPTLLSYCGDQTSVCSFGYCCVCFFFGGYYPFQVSEIGTSK